MANLVVFDASAAGSVSSGTTSFSWTHSTTTLPNRILVVGIWIDSSASDVVTGVTYGGVAMTRINTVTISTFRQYLYALVAPASGSNSVVVSFTGTQNILAGSESVWNAAQNLLGAQTTNSATVGSTSITGTLTTVSANAWLVAQYGNNGGTSSAGTNAFQRQQETSTTNRCIYDSNGPISPAGSTNITVNVASTPQNSLLNVMEIIPYVPKWFGDNAKGRIARFFGNDPSIVAYFQLNGSSTDNSGAGMNGTDTAIVYDPGIGIDNPAITSAAFFNGSSSQISIPDQAALSPANFTLMFWIKPNTLPTGSSYWKIFSKRDEGGAGTGWNFGYANNSGSPFFFSDVNSNENHWNFSLAGGASYFITMTQVGSAAAQLYINGILIANSGSSSAMANYAHALIIGQAADGSGHIYSGWMGEVIIFSRALPVLEINQYYFLSHKKRTPFWQRAGKTAMAFTRTMTDSIMNGASRTATVARVASFFRTQSDSILNGASRTATVSRVIGRVRTLTDSIMNGAGRSATVSRVVAFTRTMTDNILNGASRTATIARIVAYKRSMTDSIMNGAGRHAIVSYIYHKFGTPSGLIHMRSREQDKVLGMDEAGNRKMKSMEQTHDIGMDDASVL
jgi:hypothetical protein